MLRRFGEAEAAFRRAVEIMEKALGPDHETVASARSNLANLYRDTGRYAEAEDLLRRSLASSRKTFGPHHPNYAFDLHRLDVLLRETGRADEAEAGQREAAEAEADYRRALAIAEKASGPEGADVLDLKLRLAAPLAGAGPSEEADGLLRAVLEASSRAEARGEATPYVLARRVTALLVAGRVAEARPLAERLFATGYRRRTVVELCAGRGLPVPG